MAARTRRQPLRTGGLAWGPRRVALGVSIRELSKRAGVARGDLSRIERGRMVPTAAEFEKAMAALDAIAAENAQATDPGVPSPGSVD